MTKTGVFATKDETDECFKLAKEASEMPVISLTGMSGDDWSVNAWKRCQTRCHELALAHGLKEISGYYGITKDGEFVLS